MQEWHGYPEWNTYTVRDARNCCIATVGDVDRLPAPENLDNARLLACAPLLLEALVNLLEDVEFAQPQIKGGLIGNRQIKKARAAIAEAKGESS